MHGLSFDAKERESSFLSTNPRETPAEAAVLCVPSDARLSFAAVLAIDCFNCSSHEHIDCGEVFIEETSQLRPVPCHVFEGRYCIKTTGVFEGKKACALTRGSEKVKHVVSLDSQGKSAQGGSAPHETMATTVSTSSGRETCASTAAASTPAIATDATAALLWLSSGLSWLFVSLPS